MFCKVSCLSFVGRSEVLRLEEVSVGGAVIGCFFGSIRVDRRFVLPGVRNIEFVCVAVRLSCL